MPALGNGNYTSAGYNIVITYIGYKYIYTCIDINIEIHVYLCITYK